MQHIAIPLITLSHNFSFNVRQFCCYFRPYVGLKDMNIKLNFFSLLGVGMLLVTTGKQQEVCAQQWKVEGNRVELMSKSGLGFIVNDGTVESPAGLPIGSAISAMQVEPLRNGWVVLDPGAGEHTRTRVWSWDDATAAWSRGTTRGEQPDLNKPFGMWAEAGKLHVFSVAERLEHNVLDLGSGDWKREAWSEVGPWKVQGDLLEMDDYLVWSTADRTLYIFEKQGRRLASFPADAWSHYIDQASRAHVIQCKGGNQLEAGPHEGGLSRYDFNEKIRYADFQSPFTSSSNEVGGEISGAASHWSIWMLALTWGVGAVWFLQKRRRRNSVEENGNPAPHQEVNVTLSKEVLESISHWSEPVKRIVLAEKQVYTTAELDVLFDIQDVASPETLRARRSRLIQSVNTEFNLLFGYDLIRRRRDDNDRRKVLYTRSGLPPQLAKSLQRDRMHELHANNGAYRADGVTEDGQ